MLVRWYEAYALSYRDIEELASEHGLKVDHSTINRWVIHYVSMAIRIDPQNSSTIEISCGAE